jgi:L-iditol 2-dehydrogenase
MKPLCDFCRTGRYNACPEVVFFSTPPCHGTLTRYHVHPEDWLHRLPDDMTFEEGSLLEPLSVALAGIERSGLRLGEPIAICGAGPIGLVTLLAANAAGANPIVITDLDQSRLATAKQFVPRVKTLAVDISEKPATVGARIIQELGGVSARLVFECTGIESSLQAAIYVSFLSRPSWLKNNQ